MRNGGAGPGTVPSHSHSYLDIVVHRRDIYLFLSLFFLALYPGKQAFRNYILYELKPEGVALFYIPIKNINQHLSLYKS